MRFTMVHSNIKNAKSNVVTLRVITPGVCNGIKIPL